MSFNTSPGRAEYTASTGQTVFPFVFKIFNDSDIKVYQTPTGNNPDDTNDLLILTTDYTVTIDGDAGGQITLVSAASSDDAITLLRDLLVTREVEYQTSGDLLAETLNDDQEYQTYLLADNKGVSDRTLIFPESTQSMDNVLPVPEALKLLRWRSDEKAIENTVIADDGVFVNIFNVNTIADLSTVNPDVYSTVNVRGYHSANDGGGGIFNYDVSQSAVNNGGTIIDGWIRQYNGAINIKWFGAKTDGTDTQSAILLARDYIKAQGGGHLYFPEGTYSTDDLDFTTVNNCVVTGDGYASIIDFKFAAASSDGLDFGSTVGVGGTQNVEVSSIKLINSGANRLNSLLRFYSGPTGQTPPETSGFMTLRDLSLGENADIGILLENVSHVSGDGINSEYQTNITTGLKIKGTIDINTGVFSFNNCVFRGDKTALDIEATVQLLDSFAFQGCGFFNHDNTNAREAIVLNGNGATVGDVSFIGCHLEARNNQAENFRGAVSLRGEVRTVTFNTSHFSCGSSVVAEQADYGIGFEAGGEFEGIFITNCEFLRIKDKATGGAVLKFFSGSTYKIENPIVMKGIWRNATVPEYAIVQDSTDIVSLDIEPDYLTGNRIAYTRGVYIYELEDSTTPSVKGKNHFEITSAYSSVIDDFIDEIYGQEITIINTSGGNITISHDAFKIRCKGAIDLTLGDNDIVKFIRVLTGNHWIQSGEIITT